MAQIKTVYDHIHSNNIKTALLVLLFPLIFIGLVFLFTWLVSPIESAIKTTIAVATPIIIVCFVWMLISWAFGDSMMLGAAHAHEISPDNSEHREIYRMVENIALAAGLPTPRVYIINDNSLNAFATGRTHNTKSRRIGICPEKISTSSRVECLDKVKSMSSACIANPSAPREFIGDLMATHPPIDKRIERLESMNIK